MKIALVSHVYLPNIGGVENYVFRLFRDLTINGENVYVLTSDIGVRNKIDANKSNKKVKYFRAMPIIFRNPITMGLVFHLWNNEYDVIHAHSIHSFPTLISLILRKNSKFIITAHGVAPDNSNLLVNFVWKLYIPIAKYLCAHSDNLIVLGKREKEKLIKLLNVDPEKIEVIPNGIDIAEIPDDKIIRNFVNKFGLDRFKIILYAGRISPIKNLELLLNAFSIINKTVKNTKLLLVGPIDERYRDALSKLANDLFIGNDIVFTGEVSQQELFASYMISYFFVSLGTWEGLPTTMLEAMFFAKPCIMFDSGGIEDIIRDGETGFLIRAADREVVAQRMLFLLGDEEQKNSMGKNAREEVLEKYLWRLCFNEIRNVYLD